MNKRILATAAATGALALGVAPAAMAAPVTYTYSLVGAADTCHLVSMTGTAGTYTTVSDRSGDITRAKATAKTTVNPGATFLGSDGVTYGYSGNATYTATFNGVYWKGKYTYKFTFTKPDGAVFGTWSGTMGLDPNGRPVGARTGTCAAP